MTKFPMPSSDIDLFNRSNTNSSTVAAISDEGRHRCRTPKLRRVLLMVCSDGEAELRMFEAIICH